MALVVIAHDGSQMSRMAVKPKEMRGVYGVFHRLKPVTINHRINHDPASSLFPREDIPAGQQRPRLRSKISEQQPAEFFYRIGGVFDAIFESAPRWLGRLLETSSAIIKFPAVIRAADSLLVHAAKGKRRRPMRAVLANETVMLFFVAVEHQLFAQYFDGFDRLFVRELSGDAHRLPVAAQQLSRRRASLDAGQQFILFAGKHVTPWSSFLHQRRARERR